MPVQVSVGRGRVAVALRLRVARWARRMLAALELERADLAVRLTGDDEIRVLNRTYRKKDAPTDVLAFAMREGPKAELAGDMLGDVVISIETTRAQAKAHNRPFEDELVMLLAHGLLHLVGYDHQTARQERRMTARTDELCALATARSVKRAVPGRRVGAVPARARKLAKN